MPHKGQNDQASPGYLLFRLCHKPNGTVVNDVIVRCDVVFDEAFKSSMLTTTLLLQFSMKKGQQLILSLLTSFLLFVLLG